MPMNDYWNPDQYRERLRQTMAGRPRGGALAPAGQGPMAPGPAPAAPTGAPPSVTDTTAVVGQQLGQPSRGAALQAAPQRAQQAPQPFGMAGAPAAPEGAPPAKGKTKIPTGPPNFKPEVDEEALAKAKTFPDIMDAMDKSSQGEYMDWWEQQYGSVNAKWNKVQEDIGKRPDPRRKMSRREKFDTLMEFGLNLMRASQPDSQGNSPDTTTAMSGALHDTVRGQQAQRYGEQQTYDARVAGAQAGRAAELKELGNRGAALKTATDIENTQGQIDERKAEPGMVEEVMDTTEGKVARTKGGALSVLKSPDTGKPLRADPRIGSRGGALQDYRPSEEKKFEHLMTLGLPKEVAMRVAYRQSTGDPRKDYLSIYKTALSSTMGDEKSAKKIAQSYIELTYGAGVELDAKDQPMLPPQNDPLGIRGQ